MIWFNRFLILSAFIASSSLFAQSSVDDLFGEMDAEIKEDKKTDKDSFWGKLKNGTDFEFRLRNMQFTQKPEPREDLDDQENITEFFLKQETSLKLDNFVFNLNTWLEYGTQEDTYRGMSNVFYERERYRHIWEVNELNLIYSFDKADITVGKKVYRMGLSSLYSPADQFLLLDSNVPVASKELGIWQAGIDFMPDVKSKISFFVFPVFNPDRVSSPSSRWSGTGNNSNSQFIDVSPTTTIENEDISAKLENLQALIKYKATLEGIDWFVAVANKYSAGPVLYEKSSLISVKRYVPVLTASSGFSAVSGKLEYHAEALFQMPRKLKDDRFLAYVGGGKINLDEEVKFLGVKEAEIELEYAGEWEESKQNHSGYTRSSKDSRRARNNLISKVMVTVHDDLRIGIGQNFDFAEGGEGHSIGMEYKWGGRWSFSTYYEVYKGKENTYFGIWRDNDRVVIDLSVSF